MCPGFLRLIPSAPGPGCCARRARASLPQCAGVFRGPGHGPRPGRWLMRCRPARSGSTLSTLSLVVISEQGPVSSGLGPSRSLPGTVAFQRKRQSGRARSRAWLSAFTRNAGMVNDSARGPACLLR